MKTITAIKFKQQGWLKSIFVLFLFILFGAAVLQAQQLPFQQEINAFKKQDSIHPPVKNAILFVGSSSFRMWKNVQADFPGYTIVNRGFGGSTITDVIHYADDIIFPYEPRQIVIYCGENDLAFSDTVSAQIVIDRFKSLFFLIRDRLPTVPIVFVSIKPSPVRQHLFEKVKEANKGIKKFIKKQSNVSYADVFHEMTGRKQQVKQELFIKDNLHMNEKGYAIWQKVIKPYLLKD